LTCEDVSVPIFRSLDLYPQTGWRDTPWAESPAEDAMVRTARRVCESINTGLADLRLQAPRARTQLLTLPSTDAGVQVLLFEDWLDHNIGQVLVPAQAHEWSPQQRAAALVDGLEAACALLGTRLGWDRAALVRAFAGVRASACRYHWSSRWRASRDRRVKARLLAELRDDGFGALVVEVRNRSGESCFSPVLESYSTPEGFTRTASTVEWVDGNHVTLDPSVDFLGRSSGSVMLAVPDFLPDNPLEEDLPAPEGAFEAPAVSEAHWRDQVTEPLEHIGVSLVLDLGVPRQVEKTVNSVNAVLNDLLRAWLMGAGVRDLEYVYEAASYVRTGVQVRDRRPQVHIFQRRAIADLSHNAQECDRLVRSDIQEALDRLAKKLGTGPAPRLPIS
jgi:hypothetical protein